MGRVIRDAAVLLVLLLVVLSPLWLLLR